MALRSFGKDPETNGDHCPTVWLDEEKQEFVFQGWKADEVLQAEGPSPVKVGTRLLITRRA
ncbi:hypothetical protein [Streptomyces sp. NPDC050121]|uniref:hypothetical protein n=1 Tax=Streptomyces sp. NPDC050121 TaxID=3365601 RepID=UPI0037A55A1A